MQQTRQHILDILRQRGTATVDEMVSDLRERINHDITAVTVRHHLDVLRSEALVSDPISRRRTTPGRPQHVYALTDRALDTFPNNYQALITTLLGKMKQTLPSSQVNVILEGVADEMVATAQLGDLPLETRLDHVVAYLNDHGYDASWEYHADGFVLHTRNCPYQQVAGDHAELCGLDMRLISGLVGVVPRALGRINDNAESCAYLIPVR
jgi:predicted ArsR family transcriptional regulator